MHLSFGRHMHLNLNTRLIVYRGIVQNISLVAVVLVTVKAKLSLEK